MAQVISRASLKVPQNICWLVVLRFRDYQSRLLDLQILTQRLNVSLVHHQDHCDRQAAVTHLRQMLLQSQ